MAADKDKKLNTELESFRQQWLSDLRTKNDVPSASSAATSQPRGPHAASSSPASASSATQSTQRRPPPPPAPSLTRRAPVAPIAEDEGQYIRGPSFDEEDRPKAGSDHRTLADSDIRAAAPQEKQLVSALDHFEEAMDKEAQGNMGDSLKLYRKAYRLDHGVDKRYREKHFPAGTNKPPPSTAAPATSSSAATDASQTQRQQGQPKDTVPASAPQSLTDLIASFSSLRIQPAEPPVEGESPPPCPVASLPEELLVHILRDVAVADVGDFVRLAQVCRRLAFLVSTEQRIWRRVCVGEEFGFAAMHRRWQRGVEWGDVFVNEGEDDESGQYSEEDEEELAGLPLNHEQVLLRRCQSALAETLSLVPSPYASWTAMFRSRPRIRFNGCYISTVNYVRTGQASANQSTWGNNPIHIVTYYRYLRFFRDGSAISLLTTSEPRDVVHHMRRDLLLLHRDAAAGTHLPSAVMHHALKGRWRLSSAKETDEQRRDPVLGLGLGQGQSTTAAAVVENMTHADREARLVIETEGPGPQYLLRMELALQSAGKGPRCNKLVWGGFYSFNKQTEDWGEFTLKQGKPYFFSRVKSYRSGE